MPFLRPPDLPDALGGQPLRVGLDLVDVRRIQASLDRFGARFLQRLFSPAEIAYACASARPAEHLAARFAAKEAAIKAFDLAETGVDWRDIEVARDAGGVCTLELHGRAAATAGKMGVTHIAVSLSHDAGMAGAVVFATCDAGSPCPESPTNDARSVAP
jgi:holo-[acyl-carrier protein] synthase